MNEGYFVSPQDGAGLTGTETLGMGYSVAFFTLKKVAICLITSDWPLP